MSKSDKQWIFLQNVALLILFAKEQGFKLTGGELKRTTSQQLLYLFGKTLEAVSGFLRVTTGRKLTKTMKSDHLNAMAIDLNIFYDIDGDGKKDYNPPKEISKILGEKWKSYHSDNYWGGDWGWDTPHFGMRG
jgi:hypothetical protein